MISRDLMISMRGNNFAGGYFKLFSIKNISLCIIASLIISIQLILPGIAPAEQIQTIPITPAYQSLTSPTQSTQPSIQGQLPTSQPQPPQPAQPAAGQQSQTSPRPSVEKLSEFEQFISEKVLEITDTQFEILKKYEGIAFSYRSQPPSGKVAVPVKVVKLYEKGQVLFTADVDAGFIIGAPEAINIAFKVLGLRSSFRVSTDIKQFGYDLFRQPPSTFAPVEKVPVGPDYVLGPGDEIRITVWGKIEGQWNVVVDRDGNISLPKIGIIGVTGLTFKELKEVLNKELSKYYVGFEMNVSMGALRTIRVYVVGNAVMPGAYTVSSLSTLVNALFEAGGPGKVGTMRDIQLKRNGKAAVNFDMYDFLLKGDKTRDVRLMPEDVIFIPPVGQLVGIAGNIKNPAIYELKGETRLLDLIQMAGGLTSIAFKGRVQVQRIEDHQCRTIFEGDLIDIEKNSEKNFNLGDGDLIKVFSVVETKNTITITGAVANPGEYGIISEVTKVRDVISLAGGLLYYASNHAEITRVKVTQSGPRTEMLSIDLSKAMEGDPQHDVPLEINDYLFVRTVPEWRLYQTVTIQGEVKFPGTYTIKKCERLSSLIERAGGFTDKAYLRGAVYAREGVRELQQKQLDEMVERLERELLGRGAAETASALSSEEAKVKEYEIKQKRDFVASLKGVKAKGRMAIKIDQPELLKKTLYDVELEEGDSLFIPSNPQSVQVIGSVYNQTAFVYDKDKSVPRYIDLAGGFTENADKKRIYVLKADGTAVRPHDAFLGISWSRDSNRWEIGSGGLDPGDTIVVPEKMERVAWMREVKDITQILYQIAVTAGVLFVAF